MAKRFYDSMKFDDPWYRKLTPKNKCFWEYLLCKCTHSGIWKPDFEMAEFCIGESLSEEDILKVFKDRVQVLDSGDWFILKYILFQQKINNVRELNPENNAHKSIIDDLEKRNLLTPSEAPSKGLSRGIGNSKGKGKVKVNIFKKPTVSAIEEYCGERKNKVDGDRFFNHYESNGWMVGKTKMKDWRAAVRTWEKNTFDEKGKQDHSVNKRGHDEWKGFDEPSKEDRKKVSKLISDTAKEMK